VKDRTHFILAGLVAAAIFGDVVLNDSTISLFLVHKLFQLVEYLQFWR
jgi:hypothetical protein